MNRGAGSADRYATVNGLKMYYEVHGTGKPLVLLHGGFGWALSLPALAKDRQAIAVELQGHGHTPDIDRPMSYEQMADDTAELLKHLQIDQTDIFGHSMGGTVALAVAIRHPKLVRRVVALGCPYGKIGDSYELAVQEAFESLAADIVPQMARDYYEKFSPHPKNLPVLVAKLKKMAFEFKGFPPNEMKSIQARVLVAMGDRDVVRLEHAVEMYRLMPNAQLAVFPDTDHSILERNLATIATFLNDPAP
jgi:pimeloyl-ACP methyl ester carboxylesterase